MYSEPKAVRRDLLAGHEPLQRSGIRAEMSHRPGGHEPRNRRVRERPDPPDCERTDGAGLPEVSNPGQGPGQRFAWRRATALFWACMS
jgi:hypothetical protein